ncbi:MAG: DUF5686 and carboxypeptidase regulatory-like domain-containing protein [Flavobacteriaceae bacterium]|nr:DUF5686 and carboxypeptidase regulatory-like domain-containing protein [Flavobacteriaceae bacterium]
MKLKLTYIIFLLVIFNSFSQTKVGGRVFDTFEVAVPFANVLFKNSNKGTITDENGRFYLESDENYDTLVISFVGYQTKEITLDKRTTYEMRIELEEESSELNEIVLLSGKLSKKNNPAIDILRKIWENRRENGVKKFKQYSYDKYEKLEFDLNTIDSALINSRLFKGMEFVFDYSDTSKVTGKTYLPIFINEAIYKVYGDNLMNLEKEILEGNKNSGFSNNQAMIEFVKELYADYDIYDNYLKFFDKAFTSPLSKTGIDVYNYSLLDSAYRDNKWCYNIVFYPRRKGELTFRGDFWVNDTTWAIKEINMHLNKSANINWVKEVYIEQEFDVLNDSIFLLKRDHFMSDFSFSKKEEARGVYGKRTTLYENHVFDQEKDRNFYRKQVDPYQWEIYNRPDNFWEENRMEKLNKDERQIYEMLDTLQTVRRFQRLYSLGTVLASGYYELPNFDLGPVFSIFGFNESEGMRIRAGGRTYFSQNDLWRLEGFLAYGFKDDKFKYGISGKWLLDRNSRLIVFGGNRRDVEQTGASLTTSNDVLGRNLASSSLITVGSNDRLTNINLSTFGLQLEPIKNLTFRSTLSYRTLKSATDTFSIDYFDDEGNIQSKVSQTEIEMALGYTPGIRTSGFGVERTVINEGKFPQFYFGYTQGLKDIFESDFEYQKAQLLYTQPWNLGGIGRLYSTIEAGKIFGEVPLSLLSPVPGNQTLFSIYNTFTLLDYYEFVSDTYTSLHLEHNLGGRLFSRIGFLRNLNLREIIGFRAIYGEISEENIAINASNIIYQAPEDIYYEYSFGVGNIFKIFRIDFNFRGNYFENEGARSFGVTGSFGFQF